MTSKKELRKRARRRATKALKNTLAIEHTPKKFQTPSALNVDDAFIARNFTNGLWMAFQQNTNKCKDFLEYLIAFLLVLYTNLYHALLLQGLWNYATAEEDSTDLGSSHEQVPSKAILPELSPLGYLLRHRTMRGYIRNTASFTHGTIGRNRLAELELFRVVDIGSPGSLIILESPVIPTDFPKFAELPLELQTKIWEAACSQVLIVRIHSRALVIPPPMFPVPSWATYYSYERLSTECHARSSKNTTSALFRASIISREVILKRQSTTISRVSSPKRIRFNADTDTIVLLNMIGTIKRNNTFGEDTQAAFKNIKTLCLVCKYEACFKQWHPRHLRYRPESVFSHSHKSSIVPLRTFAALERLIIVPSPNEEITDFLSSGLLPFKNRQEPMSMVVLGLWRWKHTIRKAFEDRIFEDANGVKNTDRLPVVDVRSSSLDFPGIVVHLRRFPSHYVGP